MTEPSVPARRNIELKARVASLDAAREICKQFAALSAIERQTDTYFHCGQGRLKLRERDGLPTQLVGYARPDAVTPRASDYWLVPVAEPALLKAALVATLGTLVVVEKEREVFLYRNVRIHLDRVVDLGEFVEFEAVMSPADNEEQAADLVAELAQRLGVRTSDRIEYSYSDLLLVKRRGKG
ncbi:MAG TPA: class IV adenylate cyclase [Pirellulales bacterium]|nr:class IV adenylate cyclase [Pirellulales bacterium]